MELWQHQKNAIDRAGNRFGLFFDPGCGKSRTALELYKRANKQYAHPLKALIFAPLNVCRNWRDEINKFLNAPAEVFLCAGQSKQKKLEELERFAESRAADGAKICICNIESLRGREYLTRLESSGAVVVIVDESHNFKSPVSLQTKGLLRLDATIRPQYLYLLSGTPAPQGEIDLWSTFVLLRKTNDNFYVWRKRNFVDLNGHRKGESNYWPNYRISESARAQLQHQLHEVSAVARKNEVLDLPPLLRVKLYTALSAKQSRLYNEMLHTLCATNTDGEKLTAANALARTLRLQQIIAGHFERYNPRLDTLRDAIEMTNGQQFIVWTIFKSTYSELARLLDDMRIPFAMLTGDESPEGRHKNMTAFQAGELRALIAHPRAGGVGVNLTAASFSIHYTRGFSLTDDMQAEARNYRAGSEMHERITRVDIIAENTLDEDIVEALEAKKNIQDFILQLTRKYGHAGWC